MSNEKTTNSAQHKTPVTPAVDRDGKPAGEKKPAKVVSLAIDDNDGGSDPYNHTGSHAVPDFARED
jgi:hypothetical protein